MAKNKASETAIAVRAVETLDTRVNSFVSDLTAVQQTAVRENVKAILSAQSAMVKARLVVGECLSKLFTALGKGTFESFIDKIGPKLGISKPTAYRYFGGYKMVHGQFGQAAESVLMLTDGGNQITVTDQKTGYPVLTREANKVLERMKKDAPLPENATPEQKEQWSRTFVQGLNKESRTGTKGKSPLDICEERITAVWDRFEDILERVNKLKGAKERKTALDSLKDTIEAMSTEHAKLAKTISAIPAATETAKPKAKAKAKATPEQSNIAVA